MHNRHHASLGEWRLVLSSVAKPTFIHACFDGGVLLIALVDYHVVQAQHTSRQNDQSIFAQRTPTA